MYYNNFLVNTEYRIYPCRVIISEPRYTLITIHHHTSLGIRTYTSSTINAWIIRSTPCRLTMPSHNAVSQCRLTMPSHHGILQRIFNFIPQTSSHLVAPTTIVI